LVRSNEDMGKDYIIELTPPTTSQWGPEPAWPLIG
jgi:hypothetical protein